LELAYCLNSCFVTENRAPIDSNEKINTISCGLEDVFSVRSIREQFSGCCCGVFGNTAVREEQNLLQYPLTTRTLSISSPDKRCPWGGVSRYQPAV
jgi:hypothetical protein